VVFGHSCHVCQGIEFYRGRPILYSTGNFVDDYAVDEVERNDRSFIFCLETGARSDAPDAALPDGNLEYQPFGPVSRGRQHQREMRELCAEFGTPAFWRADEECLEVVPP
jgi:poly-gamma-glutamate synthesis protein (capsule biosynthesis protein)